MEFDRVASGRFWFTEIKVLSMCYSILRGILVVLSIENSGIIGYFASNIDSVMIIF